MPGQSPTRKRQRRRVQPAPAAATKPAAATTVAPPKTRRTRVSAVSRIQSASALTHRKFLLFGPSGAGKTTVLGSAQFDPRTQPFLLCDFEGGSSSLAGSGVHVVRIRDWQDYTEVYAYLAGGDHPYKSVGVDSISETHVFALLHIVEEAVASSDRSDPDEIQRQDYGKAMVQLRRFLRAWRDLDMHVFLTALPKEVDEPGQGKVAYPALFGAMALETVGMFDASIYLSEYVPRLSAKARKEGVVAKAQYIATLHGDPKIRARVKTGWTQEVPEKVVIPRGSGITVILDALGIPKE